MSSDLGLRATPSGNINGVLNRAITAIEYYPTLSDIDGTLPRETGSRAHIDP
jgi:hypothetical protein